MISTVLDRLFSEHYARTMEWPKEWALTPEQAQTLIDENSLFLPTRVDASAFTFMGVRINMPVL